MNKQTFENVKAILTSNHWLANGTDYSLSISDYQSKDFEFFRIVVYPNNERGSFNDYFASFFCRVADITECNCSFRSENGVCVCRFY